MSTLAQNTPGDVGKLCLPRIRDEKFIDLRKK